VTRTEKPRLVEHSDEPEDDHPCDLTGTDISVISIYYAPDRTGIAPYTTEFCQHLASRGARVRAVVGIPHYPQWTVNPAFRFTLLRRESSSGVEVTRVRHTVPRHQDALRRGTYELSFLLGSRLAVRRHRPNIVIGVTPNLAGAATAAALGARHHIPVGVIVQDLVGRSAGQAGVKGSMRLARTVAALEGHLLRRADCVAAISEAFVPVLHAMGVPAERIVRFPNHTHVKPSAAMATEARQALGWPVDRRLIVHTGNMGLKQDLDNVLDTARLAADRRSDLVFVLVGHGNMRCALERRAAGSSNVRFVDPVSPSLYPLTLAAADCLLVNERASVSDMSLPSKLTSYLASGRPIVAATEAAGATAGEIARSGAGIIVPPRQPQELLRAIERIVDNSELWLRLGQRGRQYAEQHLSRESAFRRIDRFIHLLQDRGHA
jgi:colanic acid biosynthesis glycosyl transferase WcaI